MAGSQQIMPRTRLSEVNVQYTTVYNSMMCDTVRRRLMSVKPVWQGEAAEALFLPRRVRPARNSQPLACISLANCAVDCRTWSSR